MLICTQELCVVSFSTAAISSEAFRDKRQGWDRIGQRHIICFAPELFVSLIFSCTDFDKDAKREIKWLESKCARWEMTAACQWHGGRRRPAPGEASAVSLRVANIAFPLRRGQISSTGQVLHYVTLTFTWTEVLVQSTPLLVHEEEFQERMLRISS